MTRSLRPFLPHAVIAFAYAAWALGSMSEATMFRAVALGHGLAPIWAAVVCAPATPWRTFFGCVGTIVAGHVAGIVTLVCWLLIVQPPEAIHLVGLLLGWSIAILAYAGFSAGAFALIVRSRRAGP